MLKLTGAAVAALTVAFFSSSASAITYFAERAVGNGFLQLSITTDDTIGILADENIRGWELTLTQGTETFTLTGNRDDEDGFEGNSGLHLEGDGLSASLRNLSFNYSGGFTYFTFSHPSFPSTERLWYAFTDGSGEGEEGILAGTFIDDLRASRRIGMLTIASSDAIVPEPATWALMITGFGMAGGMLRLRRRMTQASTPA